MCVFVGSGKYTEDPVQYGIFKTMLSNTRNILISKPHSLVDTTDFWKGFEKEVAETMRGVKQDMGLGEDWTIDYKENSSRFPDVVAYLNEEKKFGIEVKTIADPKKPWQIPGGSILESTRVEGVERIHVLCAKKTRPLQIICRKFEDCVVAVKVTHSPRYFIDMLAKKNESIFDKLGMEYDFVRKQDNPFEIYRSIADGDKNIQKWWNVNQNNEFNGLEKYEQDYAKSALMSEIKFWSELNTDIQNELRAKVFVLFPEVVISDYKNSSKWLIATHNVLCPNIRDLFSSSGQDDLYGETLPQVFSKIAKSSELIAQIFDEKENGRIDFLKWKQQVEDYAKVKTLSNERKKDEEPKKKEPKRMNQSQLYAVSQILGEIESKLH